MHDPEFETYLDLLSRFLRLSGRQREEIRRELRAHLDEALEDAAERGEPTNQVLRRVLSDFGDAAELAARFRYSHRRRRWIMNATLSAACIAFALVTTTFFDPQTQRADAARLPGGASGAVQPETNNDAQIRAALLRVMPEVQLVDQPLEQALQWIASAMNVNVHIQWNLLQNAGVNRDTIINCKVKGLSVERVLRLMFDEIDGPISYAVQDGVLVISTPDQLRKHLKTEVYDVRELIALTEMNVAAQKRRAMSATKERFDNAAIQTEPRVATEAANSAKSAPAQPAEDESSASRRVVELVTKMVSPDTWDVNGGTASIEEFNGVLVIRQYDMVHQQVRELLDSLRSTLLDSRRGAPTADASIKQ